MDTAELDDFIGRYISMWHESDPKRREEIVRSLWAENAENYTRRFTARGMVEILGRVARAHEEWVASKRFKFRAAGNTDAHNHVVKFFWEMVPQTTGPVEARGLDIFVLDGSGKILCLYQFPESVNA